MKNIMKGTKKLENQNIEPWWFWGCDKESYFNSFNKTVDDVFLEEDTQVNRELWEAIENGRL